MTGLGATGTHTGRYDQLSAVPEILNIHEPTSSMSPTREPAPSRPPPAFRGPTAARRPCPWRSSRERRSRCLFRPALRPLPRPLQGTSSCTAHHREGPVIVVLVVLITLWPASRLDLRAIAPSRGSVVARRRAAPSPMASADECLSRPRYRLRYLNVFFGNDPRRPSPKGRPRQWAWTCCQCSR